MRVHSTLDVHLYVKLKQNKNISPNIRLMITMYLINCYMIVAARLH